MDRRPLEREIIKERSKKQEEKEKGKKGEDRKIGKEREVRDDMEEMRKEINRFQEEIRKEVRNLREEWKVEIKVIRRGMDRIERKIEEGNRTSRERSMGVEGKKRKLSEEDSEEENSWREESREGKVRTEESEEGNSMVSVKKEIGKKRKERKEGANIDEKSEDRMKHNIVIKGVEPTGELKVWVYNFLLDRIKVRCSITEVRKSGKVVIVRLATDEQKAEVMKNKNRLVGGTIYIENDLTKEERDKQKEMWEWVKERRLRGEDVKMRLKRVRINGIWRRWEEIEKEEEEDGEDSSEIE